MPAARHRGRTLLFPVLVCLLMTAGTRAAEPQANLPKASVFFDGQIMRLAYGASNDAGSLMEFIPKGQTLENWTRLAAIHTYHSERLGPRKRADAILAQIARTQPKAPTASFDSPDGRQTVVMFALWSAGEPFVEFTVFAFGTAGDPDTDVGLQYSIKKTCTPEVFLQRDFEPLRDRLGKMMLREGLRIRSESDLTALRLALSPAEQAICDMIVRDDDECVDAVLQTPEERSAVVLLSAAAVAFNRQRLEDSLFLFYAGQLRLRFDEQCFPPVNNETPDPILAVGNYAAVLGVEINRTAGETPNIMADALSRVARWRPRVPTGYSPGYQFDHRLTEEEARKAAEPNRADFLSHMNDFSALLGDEDYFAALQLVRSLRVPGEDRLPTPEEYEAAKTTMARVAKEKGLEEFTFLIGD